MKLTDKQRELIYAALMTYGDKLSNTLKEIPNEFEITDKLADKAKESWNLAREIICVPVPIEKVNTVRISGIIFEHGKDDYGLWEGFALSDEDEAAIWQILQKYDAEGCSIRGTRKEIAEEFSS